MNNEPEYISVADVSKIMGICEKNVRKLARQPGFPCTVIGRKYIINKRKLFEWMTDHEGKSVNL